MKRSAASPATRRSTDMEQEREQPLLIVITGFPCSGKTRLARKLSVELNIPVQSKDFWKETLFDGLGVGDKDWSAMLSDRAYDLLFAVTEAYLASGRSFTIEGNFRRTAHSPVIKEIVDRTGCLVKQYVCGANGEELMRRCENRAKRKTRHAGHLDPLLVDELRSELSKGWIDPLDLPGEVVRVDTSRM
jgi:predicted kinase